MDTEVYTPVLIGISQSGDWFLYEGDIEKIVSDTWCGGKDCTPVVVSPNRTSHNLLLLENGFGGQYALTAIPDCFVPQASVQAQLKKFGLDAQSIRQKILA